MKKLLKVLPFLFVITSLLITFLVVTIFNAFGVNLTNMRFGFAVTFVLALFSQIGIVFLVLWIRSKKKQRDRRK